MVPCGEQWLGRKRRSSCPGKLREDEEGRIGGGDAGKLSDRLLATVIAGLAKLVEDLNHQAAVRVDWAHAPMCPNSPHGNCPQFSPARRGEGAGAGWWSHPGRL